LYITASAWRRCGIAFETVSVYIKRDAEGNVVLTARPEKERHRDNFLRMIKQTHVPDSFLIKEERNQCYTTRDPLEGQ
jgi:antitoxin VapB